MFVRVGSREGSDDPWWYERGPHGLEVMNEAGRELLSFLSINGATVCNTWFKKKEVHKHTWQHPKSKCWHCIDYAVMRKSEQWRCTDAMVVRGAMCNTDHMMLRLKVRIEKKPPSKQEDKKGRRFDVAQLGRGSGGTRNKDTVREKYVAEVSRRLKDGWCEEGSVEEQWQVMKSALCKAADSTLGTSLRKKADWFEESAGVLRPMLEKRRGAYLKWLDTGNEIERKKFAEMCSVVRRAVRDVKNSWFLRKAQEAECGKHRGRVVWSCIRDIQRGRTGLVPMRAVVVKDEEGNPCKTPEAQQQRWRRHFSEILNLQSEFTLDELELVRQRPVTVDLTEPPSEEELERAIGKLRSGKAGGESGILPEMVKAVCYEEAFMSSLLKLTEDMWRRGEVPSDWCDAVLIPLPMKGDLSHCDNWRGISLLDVVGKVVARMLQERLQKLAEDQLSESQCGFRKGRDCTDMIFTVRQLVEKFWEHTAKTFFTFIDLRKAYDSVPRDAL